MTPDAPAVLDPWSSPIAVDIALCLAALVYTRGWFRLRVVSPHLISAGRLRAFLTGVAFLWMAIGSPVEALDDTSLTVHMMQHLLLMAIAPPLILLGSPALPLLRGLPQSIARNVLGPFLRWGLVKSLARFLANPAVCWLAGAFALIGWHVPAVFELALRQNWLHELEHASFFGSGLLFWWPVVQPWPSAARWPRWSIPLYLFCATLPCDALSAFLAFCDRVVYPSYISVLNPWNLSPIEDQECAAALMWVSVTIIFLVPAVIVTMQILSPQGSHSSEQALSNLQEVPPQPLDASKLESI
jgi:putative membrane protein